MPLQKKVYQSDRSNFRLISLLSKNDKILKLLAILQIL